MGFEDRAYSRRPGSNPWGWLQWIVSGSVPLFTVAGVHVRAHASLVILIALTVLFGGTAFSTLADRLIFPSILFAIVLLHEFGHVFACRLVGGDANEIVMHPLGGLAMVSPPRRPLPDFITTAGGPAVNVAFLLISAIVMYALGGRPSWNPLHMTSVVPPENTTQWAAFRWAYWLFVINYGLLLFNLIPSFPLDGGRMLLAALWRPLGYFKAALIASTVGIIGGAAMMIAGLTGVYGTLMIFIGLWCVFTCIQFRNALKAAGPWAFQDEDSDYSAATWQPPKANPAAEAREDRRRDRQQAAERAEQDKIDRILQKVHRNGMNSLNFFEKRALKTATERQRQRNLRGRR